MNNCFASKLAAVTAGLLLSTVFCAAQTVKATLAISSIKPIPSLTTAMAGSGKANSLARVVEAYDSQLIDRLNASRKFEIVGRSDLNTILKEQELAGSGNVATDDPNAAEAGQLAGAQYVLVATIDDFEDINEKIELANLNKVGFKRKVRLSTTAKIYDSTTGQLMESTYVQTQMQDNRLEMVGVQWDSEETDALLVQAARDSAGQIATRVADIIFPVRVLVKRDNQVTINRGNAGGVELGQVFNVFAQGEELVDPDTHEVLGLEEVLVGKARVVSVQPKFSTAEILEDLGIDRGAVLRPAVSK